MYKRLVSLMASCEPLSLSVAQAANASWAPPPHSALSRTLPQAWQLSEVESDALWQAFDSLPLGSLVPPSCESVGPHATLLAPEDDIELILASSAQYLLHLVGNPDAFDVLVDSLRTEVGLTIGRDVNDLAQPSEAPIIGSIPPSLVDMPLSAVAPRESLARFCEDEAIGSLGLLRGVSEAAILSVWGLRADALLAIEDCYSLSGLVERLRRTEPDRPEDLELEALVRTALKRGIKAPDHALRATEVYLYRLGLLTGKMETHRAIGAMMGLTGARIDQIEKQSLRGFDASEFLESLLPLRVALLTQLHGSGGAASLDDLTQGLASSLRLKETAPATVVLRLAEILPECDTTAGPDIVLLAGLSCLGCDAVRSVVDDIKAGSAPVTLSAATEQVTGECRATTRNACTVPVMSPLALEAIIRSEQGLSLRKGWVAPRGTSRAGVGSITGLAEEILRREARPMHFSEVHQALVEEVGYSGSARFIHACLDANPEVVRWDSGTFLHKSHMPFPYSLVRRVEDWTRGCLTAPDDLPMMSVHGVYEHFRDPCIAEGISSESALYSLLRESADPDLVYPRYPRVFLARGFAGRVPLSVVIEEHIRTAGRPVSPKELRDFVVSRMGFKDFQLGQTLARGIPNTLRTGHSALIHEDYVSVDATVVEKCALHAARLMPGDGQVSVKRVFEDLRVDCVLAGIDSPELLFSLLRRVEPDGLVTGRYPLLVRPDHSAPSSLSMFESVEEYVRSKGGPCSFQELEEEFVEKRKYGAQTVFAVAHRHHVHRYLPASVIHEDSLGLDDWGVRDLHRMAAQRCADDAAAGRHFSTALDLLEEGRLPPLPEGIVWTPQLVASMIHRSGDFALLGNARNAFVTRPNALGIETFGDLVAVLVREDYGGGVNLEVLESRLREEGVTLRQLTVAMLDGNPSVAISGMEIVAAEVTHA